MDIGAILDDLDRDGYAIRECVLTPPEVAGGSVLIWGGRTAHGEERIAPIGGASAWSSNSSLDG